MNRFARSLRHPIAVSAALVTVLSTARAQPASAELQPTIITSNAAQLSVDGTEAYTVFRDNVHLTGTNLEVTCDLLEVFGEELPDEGRAPGRFGELQTRRLVATGNVVIKQIGREATADRVEVLPLEDLIILTGDPVRVKDAQGTIDGEEIRFFRGERRIEITKPRGTFRSLPDMGFDPNTAPPPPADAERTEPTPPAETTTP